MTKRETQRTKRLLRERADRFEVGREKYTYRRRGYGWYVMAYWRDGGSARFDSLETVLAHVGVVIG